MKFLNLTNIVVALCAGSLYYETCIHLGIGEMDMREPWFVFGAAWLLYCCSRLVFVFSLQRSNNPRHLHAVAYRWLLAGCAAAGLAVCLVTFPPIAVHQWLYLLHLAVLSAAYSLPVFGRPLRSIPLLKLALLVYVWVAVTVVLPTILHPAQYPLFNIVLCERVFFVSMVAMAFNIRDIEADREAGIHTIPVQIGEARASWLAYPLGLLAIAYGLLISAEYGIMLAICNFCTMLMLLKSPRIRHETWFSVSMDSLMLLRLGLLYVYFLL